MATVARKKHSCSRDEAEQRMIQLDRELTAHRQALDALLRDEFAWTHRHEASGAWFEMGVARANCPSGGIVLIREYYPVNLKPSQRVYRAAEWFQDMTPHFAGFTPSPDDTEARAYRDCFYAVRGLWYEQAQR